MFKEIILQRYYN